MTADLNELVGVDGLAQLTALLDPGPHCAPKLTAPEANIREWVDLCRRLFIPNFEHARRHWPAALADGRFDGANEVAPYLQSSLLALVGQYSSDS